jgi:hypothetical protein
MQEEYEFIGRWIGTSELPASGNRVLVTDGTVVIFGTYIEDGWLFEGIHSSVPFNIIYWMPAPRPIFLPEVSDKKKKN